jgi:hypothetical protein
MADVLYWLTVFASLPQVMPQYGAAYMVAGIAMNVVAVVIVTSNSNVTSFLVILFPPSTERMLSCRFTIQTRFGFLFQLWANSEGQI